MKLNKSNANPYYYFWMIMAILWCAEGVFEAITGGDHSIGIICSLICMNIARGFELQEDIENLKRW